MNKKATDTMQGEQKYIVSWHQGGLVEGSMNMERKEQQLQAVSNLLGEDSEGGSFAKDISSEGWISESRHLLEVVDEEQYPGVDKEVTNRETEKLVGKPVVATNARKREICDAEDSEESHVVSRQQVELVEDTMDTVRMEQLLQAGSTTLVGNQGDGKMVSVGGGKVTLKCGDCDYRTQQINPKKARRHLAQ
jgi:hypothetical protein